MDHDRAHVSGALGARVASPLQNLRKVATIRRTVMALTSAVGIHLAQVSSNHVRVGAEQVCRAEEILWMHPTRKARRTCRREGAIDDVDVEVHVHALDSARHQQRQRGRDDRVHAGPPHRLQRDDVYSLRPRPLRVFACAAQRVDTDLSHPLAGQACLDELAHRRAVARSIGRRPAVMVSIERQQPPGSGHGVHQALQRRASE